MKTADSDVACRNTWEVLKPKIACIAEYVYITMMV